MKTPNKKHLDFIIDKLTNSIENVLSGDSFTTEVSLVAASGLRQFLKKMGGFLIGSMNLSNLREKYIN